MSCASLCRNEYDYVRKHAFDSWASICFSSVLPVLFLSILLVGIIGMVYQPRYVNEFSYMFMIGVAGTGITLFYAFIITIGSCIEPTRNKGTVVVAV
jgi:hypothetical protein